MKNKQLFSALIGILNNPRTVTSSDLGKSYMKNNIFNQDYSKEYYDILERINKNGGFLTININELKTIHRGGPLKSVMRATIKDALSKRGISFHPNLSDIKHGQNIRLYLKSSIAGYLISTLLPVNTSKDGDMLIHKLSALSCLRQLYGLIDIDKDLLNIIHLKFFEITDDCNFFNNKEYINVKINNIKKTIEKTERNSIDEQRLIEIKRIFDLFITHSSRCNATQQP